MFLPLFFTVLFDCGVDFQGGSMWENQYVFMKHKYRCTRQIPKMDIFVKLQGQGHEVKS
jgi:hypothetical protein